MKKSKYICLGVSAIIFVGIITTFIEVAKYENVTISKKSPFRHVIAMSEDNQNLTQSMAERFPYVAAITKNSTNLWSFACFASVILGKWIVTSAHCRRPGSTHRVILYQDYARDQIYPFPILLWRIHEKYNVSSPTPKYDIAVAKLNVHSYPYSMTPSLFDEPEATEIEASVWKTVSTMDHKLYLTNHFAKYEVRIASPAKCFESYGVEIDDSLICVDTSDHEDCFIHEFGPIYSGEKLVGVLAVKPQECDMKLSIFINVSFYTNWILRTTHEG